MKDDRFTLTRADHIKVGDRLDLEGDSYADRPTDDHVNIFEFELAEVTEVERETADCVRIGGDGFCVGFPVDHMLKRYPPTLERGAWVGYRVHDHGYDVTVYTAESLVLEEYHAGNHARDSQGVVEKGHPERLPKQTLRKFAKQTAQDMALQYGINLPMVQEEED